MRLLVLAVLACGACGGQGRLFSRSSDCHERAKPGAATPAAPAETPPPDPAFAQLRAYRNYYAIAGVGAYEHHFAVWFTCVEQSVSYYAVAPDGSVRDNGGAWGGLAVRRGDPDGVPADQRANADRIAAQHEADYDGASAGKIEYLGSYREVHVTERVPLDQPGDPFARMMRHAELTLRANADLTFVDGVASGTGGETRICWDGLAYGDCGPQHWFEFTPAEGIGEPQLPALVYPRSPQPADEQARFAGVMLAAARAKVAAEPGAAIDAILAAQGDTTLPPGHAPPIVVAFTIYGRTAGGDQPSGVVRVELSPLELLAGKATGTARAKVGGVTFGAAVEATVAGGVITDEDGVVEADLTLRYELVDGRGTTRAADVSAHVKALVADGAAAVLELTLPESVQQAIHDPPNSQEFPGAGAVTSFDTYLGVSARRDAWWPGSS